MPKYTAIAEFQHNGKKVLPGDELDLSDRLAQYLQQEGAIKPVEKTTAKKDK